MTDRSSELLALTRRALAHYRNRTTDQADDIMSMAVSAYTDPERYEREVDRVFRQLPLAMALSLEFPIWPSISSTPRCCWCGAKTARSALS